jgi:phosphonate degradation associated HDIG domain protein
MNLRDKLSAIYSEAGAHAYFGEPVTTLEHSLQTAYFARLANASDALVIAALLHDIGHLIESAPADLADWATDAHHEESGGRWLAAHFAADVSEPVRLHVAAKRYLCAKQPRYTGRLSDASVRTLQLQGGRMSPAEAAAFESNPHWRDAVRLREWDDRGKVAGLRTPEFADYGELIEAFGSATAGNSLPSERHNSTI